METIVIGDLIIDPERFLVTKSGIPIQLTKTEFHILYLMMSTQGKIHSREQISKLVWGKEHLDFPRTIDAHISNIRRKLGKMGDHDIIIVRRGIGYKFNDMLLQ